MHLSMKPVMKICKGCQLFITGNCIGTRSTLDEFLIEESYICSSTDPRLHCFSTSTNQKLNFRNLSAFEDNETFVTCYKYVFNTGHAAASAIGIISATGLIIYIIGLVSLKLFNGISYCKLQLSVLF